MKNRSVCFNIISSATKINHLLTKLLAPYNITPSQLDILSLLWNTKEVTSKYLHVETDLDSSTIAGLTKRMVKSGYVTKTKNDFDKRNTMITLTDKGKKIQQIGQTILIHVEENLRKNLGTEPIDSVIDYLQPINKNILLQLKSIQK